MYICHATVLLNHGYTKLTYNMIYDRFFVLITLEEKKTVEIHSLVRLSDLSTPA